MDQQMIKESVNDMELKKVEERKTRSKFTAEKSRISLTTPRIQRQGGRG